MNKVRLTINNEMINVDENITVLEAARQAGINIPTLCYLKGINEVGACRMCVVEVEGRKNLEAACVKPVREGMVVKTNTRRVRESRKTSLELILSNHDRECLSCVRNKKCELQKYADELGIEEVSFIESKHDKVIDESSPGIMRNMNKCILCGRCVNTCKRVQDIGIMEFFNRGASTVVNPGYVESLDHTHCIQCGQCVTACPVGALYEKDDKARVWDAIEDPDQFVVVQTAPAVRAALGELFDYPIGTNVTGKMVSALKKIGFDRVFDTNFAADLTIMEEGTELLNRIKHGGTLPLITSCSPGWIRYCEYEYPNLIDHLSTCKSPHQMFGALVKTYYADMYDLDPTKIMVVSIMPCTAKKSESQRPEMEVDGLRDVDVVLTTRELGDMIKMSMINFRALEDGHFDSVMGDYSGAGVIFGATGGVMEAALRTVADILTGESLENIEYEQVRGLQGIKEATVHVAGMDINLAVAHSAKHAKTLMDAIESGKKDYHFVEIMGCPGGCINGGGQPHVASEIRNQVDVRRLRSNALYQEDEASSYRKSHENPEVKALYENFLKEPNSELSHKLLHTHYQKRTKYHY